MSFLRSKIENLEMKYISETDKGLVHLWDLPEKQVYIRLKSGFKTKMISTTRKYFKGLKDLSVELGLPLRGRYPTYVRAFIEKKSSSLFVIKRFSDFLISKGHTEFSLSEVEKNIEYMTTKASPSILENPQFPFDFNTKDGAVIVAGILHDGGIDSRNRGFYCNTKMELINRFRSSVGKVLKNMKYQTNKPGDKLRKLYYPTIFGLVLKTLGLKSGEKILTDPKIPKFLFNTSDEIVIEYLAQAIADDGTVPNTKKKSFIQIGLSIDVSHLSRNLIKDIKHKRLSSYASNILKGDKKLFEKLGCSVSGPRFFKQYVYRNGEKYLHQWVISVAHWSDLALLLSKGLKIPLDYKQKNLEKAIYNYVPRYLKWLRKLSGFDRITVRNLRLSTDMSYEQSRGILRHLHAMKYFTKKHFKDSKNHTYSEYYFTERGNSELGLLESI